MENITTINSTVVANPWHGLIFIVVTGVIVFWMALPTLLKKGEAERHSRQAIAFQEKFCFFDFQKRLLHKSQSPLMMKIGSIIIMLGWLLGLYLSIRDVTRLYF